MPTASSSCDRDRSRVRSRRSTRLGELGIPFRVVTNFSQLHRESLSDWFGAAGLRIDPERIITGTSATAAYTAAHHPGRPLFVLAAADALREFDGQRLVSAEEADALPPGSVAAVVIGDAGDDLSYGNMDVAFRLVHGGAELLAMHRNPWWLTPKGMTLDAGGYVAALEFATGQRARVLGKPAPEVFRQAIAGPARGPRRAIAGRQLRDGRRRPSRRCRGRPAGRAARGPRALGQDQPGGPGDRSRGAGGVPTASPPRWPTWSPR